MLSSLRVKACRAVSHIKLVLAPPFPALSLTAKLFTCIKASQTNALLIMEQIMLMDRSRGSFVTRFTPALLETLMPCETTRDPFLRNASETYNHKSREASLRIKQ